MFDDYFVSTKNKTTSISSSTRTSTSTTTVNKPVLESNTLEPREKYQRRTKLRNSILPKIVRKKGGINIDTVEKKLGVQYGHKHGYYYNENNSKRRPTIFVITILYYIDV